MERSDKRAFRGLIEMLAAAFQREVSTPFFEAYWQVLADQELASVRHAVETVLREDNEYPPNPGRLRAMCKAHKRQLELFRTPEERQLEAAQAEAEKQRVLESWKGHEDELAEMRSRTRQLAEDKS